MVDFGFHDVLRNKNLAPHKNMWIHIYYGRIEQVEDSKIFVGFVWPIITV